MNKKRLLGIIACLISVAVAAYFTLDHFELIGQKSQDVSKVYPAEQQQEIEASVEKRSKKKPAAKAEKSAKVATEKKEVKKAATKQDSSSAEFFDKKMKEYGLVDIQTLDKEIGVELKYATTDNFVGKNMYGSLKRAYLIPDFAKRVVRAQKNLRKRNPKYSLLIYDAARPISVQRAMRKMVEGTPLQDFVADGKKGGRHNYGVAVDVTITDENGKPLDMGVGFDAFEEASAVKGTPDNSDPATRTVEVYTAFVRDLQTKGAISKEAADNRLLLIEVMHEAGLYPYRREWWHFELIDAMSKVRENYRLLDF